MLAEEAVWLGQTLARFTPDQLTPLVNLGSSSGDYRRSACAEIQSQVFAPLRARGVRVIHVDLKAEPGVDIVGNICEPAVRSVVARCRPRALLCNNILEHVTDRQLLATACDALLPAGGLLFVSVPYRYPYHPDPIDTGFRPSPDAVLALWPHFTLVGSQVVQSRTYGSQLLARPKLVIRDLYMVLAGLVNTDRWRVLLSNYRFLMARYAVTCVVLRK